MLVVYPFISDNVDSQVNDLEVMQHSDQDYFALHMFFAFAENEAEESYANVVLFNRGDTVSTVVNSVYKTEGVLVTISNEDDASENLLQTVTSVNHENS